MTNSPQENKKPSQRVDEIYIALCNSRGVGIISNYAQEYLQFIAVKDYLDEQALAQGEKLDNGGKPHECGKLAVHDNPIDQVALCTKCELPVDAPHQEHEPEEWEERFEYECPLAVKYQSHHGTVVDFDYMDEQRKLVKDFIRSLLKEQKEHYIQMALGMKEEVKTLETHPNEWYEGLEAQMESYNRPLQDFITKLKTEV